MFCKLTQGSSTRYLAGGSGPASETSNFQSSAQPSQQEVQYVGIPESRFFHRPGLKTEVSFESAMLFPSTTAAEMYAATISKTFRYAGSGTAVLGSMTGGTPQVETATAVGTTTGAGNITVTVTAAGMIGSPLALTVAVGNAVAPADWSALVRTALAADYRVAEMFDIGGAGADITLTHKIARANDATLNIALANGAPSPGITAAATSTNTTAGVAATETTTLTIYDAFAGITAVPMGCTVRLNISIIGRTTSP